MLKCYVFTNKEVVQVCRYANIMLIDKVIFFLHMTQEKIMQHIISVGAVEPVYKSI